MSGLGVVEGEAVLLEDVFYVVEGSGRVVSGASDVEVIELGVELAGGGRVDGLESGKCLENGGSKGDGKQGNTEEAT
eukprot:775614-Prorocentrum_lima.AAC.1